MAETVISLFIVSVMFVAALSTVGAARQGEHKTAGRARGLALAQGLMAEILQQPYEDESSSGATGPESDEADTSRTDFDDVDDYDGWSASPPETKDGTSLVGYEDWERSATVIWINPSKLWKPVGTDKGIKRITVTVKHNEVPVASLFAFRTTAWRSVGDDSTAGATPTNNPPTAVAMGNPLIGFPPLTVMLYGGASSDTDGDMLTYSWDFGDEDTGSGEVTNHTYDDSGMYTVTLTVLDGRGGVDTDTLTVIVEMN